MKKLIISMLLLLMVCSMFITGCGDDEETVVAAASAQGYILGRVNLYPYVSTSIDIFPLSTSFNIDSAVIFDSLVEIEPDYWYAYGDNHYWYGYFSNNNDDARYQSGDTMTGTFYNGASMATFDIVLLNYYTDTINLVLPVNNDTVSLGTTINMLWNSRPNAEGYGLRVRYRKDSAGTQVYTYQYLMTTDTTYTVNGLQSVYNGYYDLYVVAFNGPMTMEPENISGAGLKGEMYSYSQSRYRRVYVGTGNPTPVGGTTESDIEDPSKVADEIINNISKFGSFVKNHDR